MVARSTFINGVKLPGDTFSRVTLALSTVEMSLLPSSAKLLLKLELLTFESPPTVNAPPSVAVLLVKLQSVTLAPSRM